jgi:hypothetical protein
LTWKIIESNDLGFGELSSKLIDIDVVAMSSKCFLGLCGYWKTMISLGFALLCSKGSPIGNIYMGGHLF